MSATCRTPPPAARASETPLADAALERVLSTLGTTADGPSSDEAATRSARYGPRALPEHRVNPVLQCLSYFWGLSRG
jgi:hypothetical protein